MSDYTEAKALGGLAAVPIGELHASPNNPRENLTDIDGLAASLLESGMIQPIVAQKVPGQEGYQIVAGHRRFAAALRLGWAKVPVLVRRDMLPDDELVAMLAENGQRAGLDPIEEARALRRLKDSLGLTDAALGRRVGYSQNTVASRLALLTLPEDEQEEIRAGHLPQTRALANAAAERQQARMRAAGRPIGRPKGRKTTPYFGTTHPLARAATARCDHRGRPKVGGVGCGECWEAVIRDDERQAQNTHTDQEGNAS